MHQQPECILSNPIRSTQEKSKSLFLCLQENEQVPPELADKGAIFAKQQMTALFAEIAEYQHELLKSSTALIEDNLEKLTRANFQESLS